ncbi:MAG TPA: tRNA lysidine(34) synthetase TilS [Bacteroidota bacterium]|nr:tRNA lysidine(34) synthetase TilS [Bacteroidota bacterium]
MLPISDALQDRFEAFLASNRLVQRGDSVLLAVSGGVDSMVMLHLFAGIQLRWNLTLTVAHINHQLRGDESEADEAFVRNVAREKGLPFFATRVDVLSYAKDHHLGKQEAARRLRYSTLENLRRQTNAHSLATAHHANDNAETVFMNALRGAGIRGLSGIPVRRSDMAVIRPLLFAYRSEIESYASSHAIPFRSDSTNDSLEYRRNRVRKAIIPELQRSGFPDIVLSLNRLAETMRSLATRIGEEVNSLLPRIRQHDADGRTRISLAGLTSLDPTLRDEVLLAILRELQIEPTAHRVKALHDLIHHAPGHRIDLAKSVSAHRDREWLVIGEPILRQHFEAEVTVGREYEFPGFRFAVLKQSTLPSMYQNDHTHEYIDADLTGSRLMLRTWKDGDWFVPLGMQARKKISDFLTDRKVSFVDRQRVPVLESDGTIVWVCGLRLDDRFKVRPSTKRVFQLLYQPIPPQA